MQMKLNPQFYANKFEWQPNVKIIVFSLLLFPLLLALGFWQLERAEEKREILKEFNLNQQLPPATFEAVSYTHLTLPTILRV